MGQHESQGAVNTIQLDVNSVVQKILTMRTHTLYNSEEFSQRVN